MTKRDHTFKVRLTDEERDVLHAEAEQLGLSAADLVRMRVFGAASMRKLPGAEDLVEIRRLLKNMADNINQATKVMHERKLADRLSNELVERYLKGTKQYADGFKNHAQVIAEYLIGIQHRR
ncbi:plasmid mobilization protein [Sulfitobacter sp. PM12]|uniref:plasmid mobilization protein n=1 Tax=Sulfitobacter sp. PM12 TaxID=3138497 RepID=UPI003890819E